MVVFVLRHGQTMLNKKNIISSNKKDIELNNEGRLEVIKASEILKKYNFDYVFTSDLIRTKETSEILQKELNQDFCIISTNKLNERNYGYLTGRNRNELENIYSKENIYKWTKTYEGIPPNGESMRDLKNRCGNYFDQNIIPLILKNKNILIISHNSVLKSLFIHLNLKDEKNIETFEISCIPIKIDIKNKSYSYE